MVHSMTAFARSQIQGDWGNLVCEMRSINHRYLEISVYLPDLLHVLEMPIREIIRKYLKRGKVECSIRYTLSPNLNNSLFSINTSLAQELCQASEKIAKLLTESAPVYPTDILRFPGVLETRETDISFLQSQVFELVERTVQDLMSARAREGGELKQTFLQRINLMQEELSKVRHRLPQIAKDQQERLRKRFVDAKVELDPNRLEQEMLIFAQKIDVAEEIDRTQTHIAEIRRVLDQDGSIGRRLDFLLQELNREANTMGSKSLDSILTHAAVEIKVLIEQIREQVQNVE